LLAVVLVGLLPLCAATVIPADVLDKFPKVADRIGAFMARNSDLLANVFAGDAGGS
jgi:hypothetical protein